MGTSRAVALILAGGSGRRMGGAQGVDKVLLPLNGVPAIVYSVRAFCEAGIVDRICFVCRDDAQQAAIAEAIAEDLPDGMAVQWARGGAERAHSVAAGLATIREDVDFVFIHDGARPLITARALRLLNEALRVDGAAVLARPVADTIKRVPRRGETERQTLEDLERDRLWAVETPQAFTLPAIFEAYEQVLQSDAVPTDDCAVWNAFGERVTLVANPDVNLKLTTPDDVVLIEHFLDGRES